MCSCVALDALKDRAFRETARASARERERERDICRCIDVKYVSIYVMRVYMCMCNNVLVCAYARARVHNIFCRTDSSCCLEPVNFSPNSFNTKFSRLCTRFDNNFAPKLKCSSYMYMCVCARMIMCTCVIALSKTVKCEHELTVLANSLSLRGQ